MLKFLKKILALTMALMVFVSSHSFAYFEHLCTITFKKTLTTDLETCLSDFLDEEDLEFLFDPPGDIPSFNKSTCCEIDYKSHQAGTYIHQNVDNSAVSPELLPAQTFYLTQVIIIEEKSSQPLYTDSSPPRVTPLHILNQIFII